MSLSTQIGTNSFYEVFLQTWRAHRWVTVHLIYALQPSERVPNLCIPRGQNTSSQKICPASIGEIKLSIDKNSNTQQAVFVCSCLAESQAEISDALQCLGKSAFQSK